MPTTVYRTKSKVLSQRIAGRIAVLSCRPAQSQLEAGNWSVVVLGELHPGERVALSAIARNLGRLARIRQKARIAGAN